MSDTTTQILHALVEAGVNLEVMTKHKQTALYEGVEQGASLEYIQYLVENKANIHATGSINNAVSLLHF